jgi:hypothetical protein
VEELPDGDRVAVKYHPSARHGRAAIREASPGWLAVALLGATSKNGVLDVAAAVDAVRTCAAQAVAVGNKPVLGHLRVVEPEAEEAP